MTEENKYTCIDCNSDYFVSNEVYYYQRENIFCPKCGSKKKSQTIVFEDRFNSNIRDSFSVFSTDIKTNRTTLDESDETPTNRIKIINLIQDFLDTNCEKNLREHFEPLVKYFSHSWISEIICYRGVNKKYAESFKNKQISPTAKEYSKNNRYSEQNEMAFYLIDNPKFIKNEICLDSWIEQKYIINPIKHKLKFADLTSSNKELDNDLALIFKITESGKSSTGINFEKICEDKYNNRYKISQFIAKLFKKYDWDGLIIPGVHGEKDDVYNNIVIFEKVLNRWQDWCIGKFYEK